TVAYAGQRQAFGRPIVRFQAVAQSLAVLVEHAELAELAVRAAAELFERQPGPAAALAKITAGVAAAGVGPRAHQIHGAIGMTEEYPLHRLIRRLHAWSEDYGGDSGWSELVGRDTLWAGAAGLWPQIVTGASAASDTKPKG